MATLLSMGVLATLKQNVAYTIPMPASRSILYTDTTTPVIQQSNKEDFSVSSTVTSSGGIFLLSGLFVRCTSGDIDALIKAF